MNSDTSTLVEPDDHCEACGAALYDGADEWTVCAESGCAECEDCEAKRKRIEKLN